MGEPDFQPVLDGELVRLRPLKPDDWAQLYAVASDPLIWEVHPQRERYKEEVFREFFDAALDCGKALVILDRRTGDIIGSSRYYNYDPDRSEVEIGWTFLARKYWGGTFNREVKRLMLDHAFRFVGTVIFSVAQSNLRSRRAMEKIGGVLRSADRDRASEDGPIPPLVFEIRKREAPSVGLPTRKSPE